MRQGRRILNGLCAPRKLPGGAPKKFSAYFEFRFPLKLYPLESLSPSEKGTKPAKLEYFGVVVFLITLTRAILANDEVYALNHGYVCSQSTSALLRPLNCWLIAHRGAKREFLG